ncbi:MAG: hypothetical protein RI989_469 [Bacteroidota bacterium]
MAEPRMSATNVAWQRMTGASASRLPDNDD